MPRRALNRAEASRADRRWVGAVWSILGAFNLYLALNAFAASFQWPIQFPGLRVDDDTDTYAVALYASLALPVTTLVMALVTLEYARRSSSSQWTDRIPVPFGLAISTNDSAWRLLQFLSVTSFVIMPVVLTLLLFRKFIEGSFFRDGILVGYGLTHFRYIPLREAFTRRLFTYQGGSDYHPFWEPIGLSLVVVCSIGMTARALWSVASRRRGRLRRA